MKKEGGLKTKNLFHKESKPNEPLVSVITVVRNGEKDLEKTIKSVINQTYSNIEYIIVDGGSTDGTLDIIKKYEDKIDYWISEPDKGIYDGMNKGIDMVKGDWIIFMNSGDIFYLKNTVENVVNEIEKDTDLAFGDWIVKYPQYGNIKKHRKAGELKDLWKGMIFFHQALFTRTNILKENKFDYYNYKTAADYDFVIKAYYKKYKFQKINQIIAMVTAGGISDVKRVDVIKEQLAILKEYDNNIFHRLYYFFLIFNSMFKDCIKKITPNKFLVKIYKEIK